MTLTALEPGVCPVCLTAECGAGYGPKKWGGQPTFTCETDLPLAETVHRSKFSGLLHRIEAEALRAAGMTAGNWLLQHGETDVAKLTTAAWETFLGIFKSSFGDEMRLRLKSGKG